MSKISINNQRFDFNIFLIAIFGKLMSFKISCFLMNVLEFHEIIVNNIVF
jgi:hypothetical protein